MKVVEALIVAVVFSALSAGGLWIRQRINAKVQADQMCAHAQERSAKAEELIEHDLAMISQAMYVEHHH
jgi:hypothetical protein